MSGLPDRLGRTDSNFSDEKAIYIGQGPERSLTSYLILPRNQEELLKALFIPVSFVIGRVFAPGVLHRVPEPNMVWHLAGFLLVFELVFYQARYLLNDLRDRHVDAEKRLSKSRFPGSWLSSPVREQFALKAALLSFVFRWIFAGLFVACILPIDHNKLSWHIGLLLGIFVIASLYETARSRCAAPVKQKPRPGMVKHKPPSRTWATTWTPVVLTTVGLGYGLRTIAGLWIAGIGDAPTLALGGVGAWLFGCTFVALTWALESTRAGLKDLAIRKAHLVLFRIAVARTAARPNKTVTSHEKVLVGSQLLKAPWCTHAVAATVALSIFTLYLLREYVSLKHASVIIGAEALIASLTTVSPLRRASLLTIFNFVAVEAALHRLSVPPTQSVVAAAVVQLPLVLTCIFRGMCYDDLPGTMTRIKDAAMFVGEALYSWFTKERVP